MDDLAKTASVGTPVMRAARKQYDEALIKYGPDSPWLSLIRMSTYRETINTNKGFAHNNTPKNMEYSDKLLADSPGKGRSCDISEIMLRDYPEGDGDHKDMTTIFQLLFVEILFQRHVIRLICFCVVHELLK